MDILNINNKPFIIFFLLLINCNSVVENNETVPLYHFNEKVVFNGYTNEDTKNAKVYFIKDRDSVFGELLFNSKNETSNFGRIKFESALDTIYKKDTICISIANRNHFFTEIVQRYVKVSNGKDRPGFIEYNLNGNSCREGEAILIK